MVDVPEFKPMRAFSDSRGYSFFNIFGEPTSGQINIGNLVGPAVKAFHYHKKQWDHWFCVKGDIHVICVDPALTPALEDNHPGMVYDFNKSVKHFYIGEHNPGVLSIPIGWWHGYCNVSQDSVLLYWVTKPYDIKDPDEYRIDWNFFGEDIWKPENK